MNRVVKVGAIYHHFKGKNVQVMAIAKDSEDERPLVVYYHTDTPDEIWVRDYDMFLSPVDHQKYPNIKQKYRFEEVIK